MFLTSLPRGILNAYVKWKKPVWKDYKLYNSNDNDIVEKTKL